MLRINLLHLLLGVVLVFQSSVTAAKRFIVNDQYSPPVQVFPLTGATATVAFSPNGDGLKIIVNAVDGAKKTILVQAYGFSSAPIAQALARAKDRGIDIRVILDRTNETARYTGATYLINHNIPVWIDDKVAIAHNKVMIIDDHTVVTGSYNFTKAAQEKNAENVIIIRNSPALARAYIDDWEWRLRYSRPYQGRVGRR